VSISQVADSAQTANQHAQASAAVAAAGTEQLKRTVEGIEQVATGVRDAARDIDALKQRSAEISGIVQVIADIANRTNLLALNAAIEAARAGEQGRGFSVVADEVRKLAEQTSGSTQEISRLVQTVLGETDTAVVRMSQSVAAVERGNESAHAVEEVIADMVAGGERVSQALSNITVALGEQKMASQQIANRVEQLAQAAEENQAVASQTVELATQLHREAAELQAAISRFKLA
jgi:methyl-accepting chemotaxis protein